MLGMQQFFSSMKITSADIALEFVDRINSHDISSLVRLMTEDHLYIDGQGNQIRGRQQIERSWRAYFTWFPDYSIQIDGAFTNGNVAALTGSAMGTYAVRGGLNPENRWKIPSAWQAIIRQQRVAEWRVFADHEPVWKILRGKKPLIENFASSS